MFIGASSVVLPGVTIGDDVIIGVNSTVTHDIPAGMVAAGCPARVLCTTEAYLEKERARMAHAPCYGEEYTLRAGRVHGEAGTDEKRALRPHRVYRLMADEGSA